MKTMISAAQSATLNTAHANGAVAGLIDWTKTVVARLGVWMQAAAARRRREAELVELDDRVLVDIGIDEAEISRLRARRWMLPRGWEV